MTLQASRAYAARHPIRRAATWRAANANKRAVLRDAPGRLTMADILKVWAEQPVCLHCGHGRGIDHIVSMIDGGSNTPDNLQNLCHLCNARKGAIRSGWFVTRGVCFMGHPLQKTRRGHSYCNPCRNRRQALRQSTAAGDIKAPSAP